MTNSIGDIGKDRYKNLGDIINGNDKEHKNPSGLDEYRVELLALRLCDKFNDTTHRHLPFYSMLARALPEAKIWDLYEIAHRKASRNIGGYFMAIGYRAMGYPPKRKNTDVGD